MQKTCSSDVSELHAGSVYAAVYMLLRIIV
jgi:hypothetical protein